MKMTRAMGVRFFTSPGRQSQAGGREGRGRGGSPSDGKAEIDDIAVPDGVGLAFEPEGALRAAAGDVALGDEMLVRDDFGADEAPLDVRVDDPAARVAMVPSFTVQALTSSLPTVKNG